jgi:o-succinylbenzoate---CoA ligase
VGGRTLTYGELGERAGRTARRLASLGVGAGDRVTVQAKPELAFVEVLHALPRLGAALAPVDPRGSSPPALDLDRIGEAGEAGVPLRERVEQDEVHSVILSSGTSGGPKPVPLTYGNHHASATASAELLGSEPDDRWLCVLPLFHVGGLAILLRSAMHRVTAVVHDRFEPERVREEIESGSVTLVSLVPTMLRRLRDAGFSGAPGVRALLLGGGPVPVDLLEWAEAEGLPVMPTYGLTETASQIATAAPGERAGRILPGAEVRIARSEGRGPRDEGEILVRGPMVSPQALADDGWLHTGDLGRLDADGKLLVVGRAKEIIVTGGENVSPARVESALTAHPAVADAGVLGLPDPEWGEAVSAFVVLRAGASEAELIDHCRELLAPYEVPKRIEQVAALPRNPAGKLLRSELAPR